MGRWEKLNSAPGQRHIDWIECKLHRHTVGQQLADWQRNPILAHGNALHSSISSGCSSFTSWHDDIENPLLPFHYVDLSDYVWNVQGFGIFFVEIQMLIVDGWGFRLRFTIKWEKKRLVLEFN